MVELVKQNYNETKNLYLKIEKKLKDIILIDAPINQVGSTAIQNIEYGKNIIDILIGAKDLKEFEEIIEKFKKSNFYVSEKSRSEGYQFIASTSDESKSGDFHIHLSLIGTERYEEFLILKQFLICNNIEAINYSKFKQEIVDLLTKDRKEYKKVKSEYVSALLKRAKEWYEQNK